MIEQQQQQQDPIYHCKPQSPSSGIAATIMEETNGHDDEEKKGDDDSSSLLMTGDAAGNLQHGHNISSSNSHNNSSGNGSHILNRRRHPHPHRYDTTSRSILSTMVENALLTTQRQKQQQDQSSHKTGKKISDMFTRRKKSSTHHVQPQQPHSSNDKTVCPTFWKNTIHTDAFGFALRMSLVLTTASLFVLLSPEDPYPEGSWVYITCCMVSWFPSSMDAASVLKKTFQRILGTVLGAALALGVGFATVAIPDVQGQALFLGIFIALFSFIFPYVVVTYSNIVGGYSYASVLVLMTFGIAVFPFYNVPDDNHRPWEKGCYRIANVIIGCVLSAIGAVTVMPKTTYGAIFESNQRQINLAGESAEHVMKSAYDIFSGNRPSIPFKQIVAKQVGANSNPNPTSGADDEEENDEKEVDMVHEKYATGIKDFVTTKSLFPLLDYDPFFHLCFSLPGVSNGGVNAGGELDNNDRKKEFKMQAAWTNQRAFRIQSTVILLDSIVRNDKCNQTFNFTQEQLQFFDRVGLLIGQMLKVPFDFDKCNVYALELCSMLQTIRHYVFDAVLDERRGRGTGHASKDIESSPNSPINQEQKVDSKLLFSVEKSLLVIDGSGGSGGVEEDSENEGPRNKEEDDDEYYLILDDFVKQLEQPDSGQPMFAQSASVLFLELVEHLILRSLRLYMTNRHRQDMMKELLTSIRGDDHGNHHHHYQTHDDNHHLHDYDTKHKNSRGKFGDGNGEADMGD